ncbi:MAG: ABC transporter permease [Candidatus Brocadiia bacterium]
MFERIKQIVIKEFIQMFRDPRMRMIIFVPPIIQMIIFGYAVSTDVKNIPTAVYDLDNSAASRELAGRFVNSPYFKLVKRVSTDREAEQLVNDSRVSAVLRFNPGFERDLSARRTAQLQLILDGTDSNTAAVIMTYASRIVEAYSTNILKDRAAILLSTGQLPGIDLRSRVLFNEDLVSRNFFIPGVIALIVTIITLLLTSMAIVREKEMGTIEQLIVSPIAPWELIMGKLLPFAVIGLADVVLVAVVGVFWFDVPIRGNPLVLFSSVILYLLTTLGIGLFISTIASTQQEAMMTTFLLIFPALLLSGFVFPIQNMPQGIQYLTYLNPLRYFLVIIRGVFLKGTGLGVLWPQMLALLIIGVAIISFSTLRFRKRVS